MKRMLLSIAGLMAMGSLYVPGGIAPDTREVLAGAAMVNLSQGKAYTVAASAPDPYYALADAVYPDSGGTELTDGVLASTTDFWEPAYQGWYRQGERVLEVDLQQLHTVQLVQLRLLQDHASGIYLPALIEVQLSVDGSSWTTAGSMAGKVPSGMANAWFALGAIHEQARYVRVIVPVGSSIVFADELQVWGQEGVYSGPAIEENLALGQSYTVTATSADEMMAGYETNYPDSGGTELTDGALGLSSLADPAWQGWARQDHRRIVVDLGAAGSVSEVRMRFLQDPPSGILFPAAVRYELSFDNIHWRDLGSLPSAIARSAPGTATQWYELDGLHHAGRYLRITVPVDTWMFADEIEAWGGRGIREGADTAAGSPDSADEPIGYPAGTERQILIFTGHNPADPAFVEWTAADFRPYAGYVDTNGDIQDTMFNSFLFVAYESRAPSGNNYVDSPPSNQADWQYLLDRFFQSGLQIDALNTAVGEVRLATGQANFTPSVYIGIPYPSPSQTQWGDLNGDSVVDGADSFGAGASPAQALANRVAAVEWYMDEAIARFGSGSYGNLSLAGFYWIPEAIQYERSPHELALLQQISSFLDGQGLKFEWIPYFQAGGFRDWELAGFDIALLQPNYMFDAVPETRLARAAALAEQYGLGVEIELDATMHLETERNKYYRYLNGGVDYGYMEGSFLAWYDWVKHLGATSRSIYADIREVYDATYRFIKGTYTKKTLP